MSSTDKKNANLSLTARLDQAVALTGSSPQTAISHLMELQEEVAKRALFSSNESLDDIATGHLLLLGLEHYLAEAYVQVPAANATARQYNLQRACELWQAFLDRLEHFEQLSSQEREQVNVLMELASNHNQQEQHVMPPPISRDVKIARFKAQQTATQQAAQLTALKERRKRLGMEDETIMDGYDDESLAREIALTTVTQLAKIQALGGWSSAIQELPLVSRMIQVQAEQEKEERHNKPDSKGNSRSPPQSTTQPLAVTHITQDAMTGQLRMERQEIQSTVFRPGWNQPTMTLEEFAQREVQQAMEREARQQEAEAAQGAAPRRYQQLVKDGMEDNADLVDASAALDRQWDTFKDENPRGSGNKRGDVGDRNF